MDLERGCKQEKSSWSTGLGKLIIYGVDIHVDHADPQRKFTQSEFDSSFENIQPMFF